MRGMSDQWLDEIASHVPNCRYGCDACEAFPALAEEIRRLRGENEQLSDLDAATTRRAELQAERDRAVQRWHDEHKRAEKAEAALVDAAGYLAAIHRHANRHDVLSENLGCAGCALLGRIEGGAAS